ncbi:BPI fold-containing family B member 4-like [Pyxicephalus adspersus]|uniref:BPI fold-containing family B member 4-like n=1 Tax=Pyxicephalus adspersus TaxID=30357 RepID=UPI003B5B5B42
MNGSSESQLGLSSNFLGRVFTGLQTSGQLNIVITKRDVPSLSLTTISLGEIISKVASMYKTEKPLVLHIFVPSAPLVKMENKHALVSFIANIDISVLEQDSLMHLFVLRVVTNLNVNFSIEMNNLKIFLSLNSTEIKIPNSLGITDILQLKTLVEQLFNLAYIPSINSVLEMGIPLPLGMFADFNNATIEIMDNLILLRT